MTKTNDIKREQKKSFLLREISNLIYNVAQEEPKVAAVYVTRVDLSADTGICYVFFDTYQSDASSKEDLFNGALAVLKLYKPSIRRQLSKNMHTRYVPQLMFMFDKKQEKVRHINDLLDQVQQELDSPEKLPDKA